MQPSTDPPVLFFSVPPDRQTAPRLWNGADDGGQALESLLGRTRAGILRTLADSCTTGELADKLSISSAGVSQHTAVLRQAGLITTRRNRQTVLHTLTGLGAAVLLGMAYDCDPPIRPEPLSRLRVPTATN
ncbi:winged helix-turn-helix transcriptional regulator [Micromonospora sp. STR1s_6]|uniref:Winged helix-turn-helix transcriptional regulator n=1 Tax=Micromonospora tarensis TaxID=2806100 RepID=A0ABS1YAM4_9ACTN|nr:winged helix-turn-helix transcriptional regulator [Micromonospora tarensis]